MGAVAPMLCEKETWMYLRAALLDATLTTKTTLSDRIDRRTWADGWRAASVGLKQKAIAARPSTQHAAMCRNVRSAGWWKAY